MRQELSPAFVQAMIWLAAVAVVALVAAVAFTAHQPPEQPEEAAEAQLRLGEAPPAESGEAGGEAIMEGETSPAPLDEPTQDSGSPRPPAPPPVIPESLRPDLDAPGRLDRPPEPPKPEPPKRVPKPKGITEDQFVEVSALMILARESFTDTPEGRKSLAEACDAILEERGIDKEAFEAYSDYLAADPETRQRIRDRMLERADELRAPRIEIEVRPTPRLPSERSPSR
jgi:hypothetical protein